MLIYYVYEKVFYVEFESWSKIHIITCYIGGSETMAVVVNLWSKRTGEIKRFLESYYKKEMNMDEDIDRWIYVYNKPLDSVDIISALMDNNDKYEISMCIQVDTGDIYYITAQNHNDIIKGMFCLFYEEVKEYTYCQ
jgi:hypothetical protein